MIVLFNSDVMHAEYLIRNRLPSHLHDFLGACSSNGIDVFLPETTVHEFMHDQEERAREERAHLSAAYSRLEELEIPFERRAPDNAIKVLDLGALFEKAGVQLHIITPTIEDYREAHLRACLHRSPTPPESDSDEMRDLVIWMSSLRLAKENGGAILISRDKVHTHARGDDEAEGVGLKRFRAVEDALAYIGAVGPAAKPIVELLTLAWGEFSEHGFPIADMPSELLIYDTKFVRGYGPKNQLVEARVGTRLDRGQKLEFRMRSKASLEKGSQLEIWDVVDRSGRNVCDSFTVQLPVDSIEMDYSSVEEKLAALRGIIGGNE